MSKTSKAYREAAEKVDKTRLYTPLEAAKLAKETSSKKQDATVEVAIRGDLSLALRGLAERLRRLDLGGDLAGMFQQQLAKLGQGLAACGAQQQALAQTVLQRRQTP